MRLSSSVRKTQIQWSFRQRYQHHRILRSILSADADQESGRFRPVLLPHTAELGQVASPGWCSRWSACSCSGTPRDSSRQGCSSCRPGSLGSSHLTAHPFLTLTSSCETANSKLHRPWRMRPMQWRDADNPVRRFLRPTVWHRVCADGDGNESGYAGSVESELERGGRPEHSVRASSC